MTSVKYNITTVIGIMVLSRRPTRHSQTLPLILGYKRITQLRGTTNKIMPFLLTKSIDFFYMYEYGLSDYDSKQSNKQVFCWFVYLLGSSIHLSSIHLTYLTFSCFYLLNNKSEIVHFARHCVSFANIIYLNYDHIYNLTVFYL